MRICVSLSLATLQLTGAACGIGDDDDADFELPPFYQPPGSESGTGGEGEPPPPNQAPEARVSMDRNNFFGGEEITLDASQSSDPEGDPITFSWEQTAKASVYSRLTQGEIPDITLSDPNSQRPTLTAPFVPSAVRYTFYLAVADNHQNRDGIFVVLTVAASGPVAVAGPDLTVTVGDTVTLDGSASYHRFGGPINDYLWQQIPIPNVLMVEIADAETDVATWIASEVGEDPVTFRFLLLVYGETDDGLTTDNDWMEVRVVPDSYIPPPIADAGDDQHNGVVGDVIMLDGSGSSAPSGGDLTFAWTQVSPSAPVIELDPADPIRPTFVAPAVELRTIFSFELVVFAGVSRRSATDSMIVAIEP